MPNVVKTEPTSITIEIVYRGIFQKTLAQRIGRSIVLAARTRGYTGTAFGRYGDSPERNGVPAKYFAVVAINDLELEASMAKYEPSVVDIAVAVDDTLVKGVESWASRAVRIRRWASIDACARWFVCSHCSRELLRTSQMTPSIVVSSSLRAAWPMSSWNRVSSSA